MTIDFQGTSAGSSEFTNPYVDAQPELLAGELLPERWVQTLQSLSPEAITRSVAQARLGELPPDHAADIYSQLVGALQAPALAAVARGLNNPAAVGLLEQAVELHADALKQSTYRALSQSPAPTRAAFEADPLAVAEPLLRAHRQTFGIEPVALPDQAQRINLAAYALGYNPAPQARGTVYVATDGSLSLNAAHAAPLPANAPLPGGAGLLPSQQAQCREIAQGWVSLGGPSPRVTVLAAIYPVGEQLGREAVFKVERQGSHPGGYVDAAGASYASLDEYLSAPTRAQGVPIVLGLRSAASGQPVAWKTEARPGLLRSAPLQTTAAVVSGVGALASFSGVGAPVGVPMTVAGLYLTASQADRMGWQALHQPSQLDPMRHPQAGLDYAGLALGATGIGQGLAAGVGLGLNASAQQALGAANTALAGAGAVQLGTQWLQLSPQEKLQHGGLTALNLTVAALSHRPVPQAVPVSGLSLQDMETLRLRLGGLTGEAPTQRYLQMPPAREAAPHSAAGEAAIRAEIRERVQRLQTQGAHTAGDGFDEFAAPRGLEARRLQALARGEEPPLSWVASISRSDIGVPPGEGGTSAEPSPVAGQSTQAVNGLKARREELGLSQAQAAQRAGISSATWSFVEAGERGASVQTREAMARALEVPNLDELLPLREGEVPRSRPGISDSPLAKRREDLGLTQAQAAQRAGISSATWSHIESGKATASDQTRKAMAHALEVDDPDGLLPLREGEVLRSRPQPPNNSPLAQRREELGLTQAQAAQRAGIEPATWSNIETGRAGVSEQTREAMARALEVPNLDELLPLREGEVPRSRLGNDSPLAQRREQLGLTQAQAAQRAGIDPATWSNIERGAQGARVRTREAMARALEVPTLDGLLPLREGEVSQERPQPPNNSPLAQRREQPGLSPAQAAQRAGTTARPSRDEVVAYAYEKGISIPEAWRTKLGLAARRIQADTGISVQTLTNLELGLRQTGEAPRLKLAEYYGIPVEHLGDTSTMAPPEVIAKVRQGIPPVTAYREHLGVAPDTLAQALGMSLDNYFALENAPLDEAMRPAIAAALGLDPLKLTLRLSSSNIGYHYDPGISPMRAWREKLGISPSEIAQQLQTPPNVTVYLNLEVTESPAAKSLETVAKAMGITVKQLSYMPGDPRAELPGDPLPYKFDRNPSPLQAWRDHFGVQMQSLARELKVGRNTLYAIEQSTKPESEDLDMLFAHWQKSRGMQSVEQLWRLPLAGEHLDERLGEPSMHAACEPTPAEQQQRLRHGRELLGLSVEEAAEFCEMDATDYAQTESGAQPDLQLLRNSTAALGVKPPTSPPQTSEEVDAFVQQARALAYAQGISIMKAARLTLGADLEEISKRMGIDRTSLWSNEQQTAPIASTLLAASLALGLPRRVLDQIPSIPPAEALQLCRDKGVTVIEAYRTHLKFTSAYMAKALDMPEERYLQLERTRQPLDGRTLARVAEALQIEPGQLTLVPRQANHGYLYDPGPSPMESFRRMHRPDASVHDMARDMGISTTNYLATQLSETLTEKTRQRFASALGISVETLPDLSWQRPRSNLELWRQHFGYSHESVAASLELSVQTVRSAERVQRPLASTIQKYADLYGIKPEQLWRPPMPGEGFDPQHRNPLTDKRFALGFDSADEAAKLAGLPAWRYRDIEEAEDPSAEEFREDYEAIVAAFDSLDTALRGRPEPKLDLPAPGGHVLPSKPISGAAPAANAPELGLPQARPDRSGSLTRVPKELTSQTVVSALRGLGFTPTRQTGSHIILQSDDGRTCSIPSRTKAQGGVAAGTLESALKKANVALEDFLEELGYRRR